MLPPSKRQHPPSHVTCTSLYLNFHNDNNTVFTPDTDRTGSKARHRGEHAATASQQSITHSNECMSQK